MSKRETVLIAIGGGDFAETGVLDEILSALNGGSSAHLTIITVATKEPAEAAEKYRTLFKEAGIKKISAIDVSERNDSFSEEALKTIEKSDGLFFTGGDQLNVTSLLGGSPIHNLIDERFRDGFLIAGTSAGAAMMSNSMIISGRSDSAPRVGAVEIAPGMNLVSETIIDTHFSQRGRHGRLLTAVAHYPQDLGIGLDEGTAIVVRAGEFKVVGDGVVTILDASHMHHCDLPYRRRDETVGLFGVKIHTLPTGYKFSIKKREPISPALKSLVEGGANS